MGANYNTGDVTHQPVQFSVHIFGLLLLFGWKPSQ